MKLSFVIPSYNAAQFIEKSYETIINQNLTDFEIIYVDNNSTDNTKQEIEKVMLFDQRIKLLSQPTQGAAAARNMGIKAAKGDYIYVFDVDDEIYPKALQKMISVLDTYPDVEAVFGKMVKSSKGISETIKPNDETGKVVFKEKPYWGLAWFSDLRKVVGPPAFLYSKETFEKIGLYNEALKLGQDTAFDIKLGMRCKVAFLDSYIYLYRKHEYSTTQIAKRKTTRAFMIWPRLVKEHLPFYLDYNTPHRFKELLFSQIYQTMARQIEYTKGFKQRRWLKQQLLNDLNSIHTPLIIKWYLSILVLMPLGLVRKLYSYYLVPIIVKHLLLKNQK